jgi:hypothetical protein
LQVYAGARPLLEKAMKILVEALVDIFLSVFHENKAKDVRLLDANGFCQLMFEVGCLITFRFFSGLQLACLIYHLLFYVSAA